MTSQDKVMYIMELLELSDRQVAVAIGKNKSTVTHKRLLLRANKFTERDYLALMAYYKEVYSKLLSFEERVLAEESA